MTVSLFSPSNTAVLLIDHQVGTMNWVRSTDLEEMKANVDPDLVGEVTYLQWTSRPLPQPPFLARTASRQAIRKRHLGTIRAIARR
jgi:hypothetical protein